MKKFLTVGGILAVLIVAGIAIAYYVPMPGSTSSDPSEPEPAPEETVASAEAEVREALEPPTLIATTAAQSPLSLVPEAGTVNPEDAEEEAAEEPEPPRELSPDELLAVVHGQPGTEEAAEAATKLAEIYENEGKPGLALTMQLEAATKAERSTIIRKIEAANRDLFIPGKPHPKASFHTVKGGENLTKISQQYKTTPGFIMRINGLKNDRIFVGQKLKIVQGPFWATVDKSEYRLTVYLGAEAFREYKIGLGKNDSTPIGDFKVLGKLTQPTYWVEGAHYDFGDPSNPLGTRWITFRDGGYGLHGTWEPESIGKQMSQGCVRMLNKDVEELYDMLVKYDSAVVIRK